MNASVAVVRQPPEPPPIDKVVVEMTPEAAVALRALLYYTNGSCSTAVLDKSSGHSKRTLLAAGIKAGYGGFAPCLGDVGRALDKTLLAEGLVTP